MKRKIINLGLNFFILLLVLVSLFIIGEIILRLKDPERNMFLTHPLTPCIRESNNPGLAYEFIPNTKCIFKGTEVKINSQGLRDYDYDLGKKSSIARIIVLGDSYTFGWGVELNESYSKILEFNLNKNNKRYEVINFGMPSHNTMQEARLLEIKAINYKPNLIIIGYTSGDPECYWDFCNETLIKATYKAYEKRLSLPINYELKQSLLTKLYFLRFISDKFDVILHKLHIRKLEDNLIVHLHNPESQTWKATQESFKKISEIAKENKSEVLLVIFPEIGFLSDNYILLPVNKQIEEEAKKQGFYVLDLIYYYKEYLPEEIKVSTDDGHPNAKAHKIAADAIYDFIKKEKII